MILPGTRLKEVSDSIGVGIFAGIDIPKGTLVYVRDVLEIELSPMRFASLEEPLRSVAEKYSFIDAHGYYILSWDTAKYVNHSCEPNTISTGYGFEIAIRDISAGEEITDEYGLFNLQQDIKCLCGSDNCRGVIRASDIDEYHEKWDSWVQDSLKRMRAVDQPLMGLMDPEQMRALDRYLDTGLGFRSVRSLKHVRRGETVESLDVNGGRGL